MIAPILLSLLLTLATPSGTIRDTVKTKVDEQIAEIKKALTKKAFLGSISAKTDATLTIITFKNLTRTITVPPETIIKLTGGKEGTLKDLKVADYILVMGDADTQNNLTAKRLLVIGKPPEDKRQVISGTVTAFTSKTLTITNSKNEKWTLSISSATKYTPAKTTFKEIDPGYKIIAVGTPASTANTLTTTRIHVVSKPIPTSTPTPTPKP